MRRNNVIITPVMKKEIKIGSIPDLRTLRDE